MPLVMCRGCERIVDAANTIYMRDRTYLCEICQDKYTPEELEEADDNDFPYWD